MYTGKYPTEHGATHHHQYLTDQPTLARQLSEAGISTGVFTANVYLTDAFNMTQGFNEVSFIRGRQNQLFNDGLDPVRFLNERDNEIGFARFTEIGRAIFDGPVIKNAANAVYFKSREAFGNNKQAEPTLAWDQEVVESTYSFVERSVDQGDQFIAMVNLIEPHAAWKYDREKVEAIGIEPTDVAPESKWEAVADRSRALWSYAASEESYDETEKEILTHLYESWVHNADELAGRLIDMLDDLGIREETAVIMTADHGESIATDGVHGHTVSVSEDIAHVPLVVNGPAAPDETVSEAVSIKDIYGTVLSQLGVETTAPSLFDESAQGEALSESLGIDPVRIDEQYRDVAAEFGPNRAIYTAESSAKKWYDTDESSGDETLLARLDELVEGLSSVDHNHDEKPKMDDEVEGRLRELGYLG
jgi:arylsulfatase A-like enzyme